MKKQVIVSFPLMLALAACGGSNTNSEQSVRAFDENIIEAYPLDANGDFDFSKVAPVVGTTGTSKFEGLLGFDVRTDTDPNTDEIVAGTLSVSVDFLNDNVTGSARNFGLYVDKDAFDGGSHSDYIASLELTDEYDGTLRVTNGDTGMFTDTGGDAYTGELNGTLIRQSDGAEITTENVFYAGIYTNTDTGELLSHGFINGVSVSPEGVTTYNEADLNEGFIVLYGID